jgi:hypothetical protein
LSCEVVPHLTLSVIITKRMLKSALKMSFNA